MSVLSPEFTIAALVSAGNSAAITSTYCLTLVEFRFSIRFTQNKSEAPWQHMNIYRTKKYQSALTVILLLLVTQLSANQKAIDLFNDGELTAAKLLFEQTKTKPVALAYLARIALRQDDLDTAKKLADKAVTQAPDTAIVQYSYGIIMGQVAQDASVFRAMGYAKKTLSGFTQAVSLEPDNIAYRQALMSYHLAAPGIVGGDKDIALQQATRIKSLDSKRGVLALISVYAVTEDKAAIRTLFSKLSPELINDPDILFRRGMYQQSLEAYPAAIQDFELSIEQAGEVTEFQASKFGALYQIGRTSVISKTQIQTGIDSLKKYMETAPELPGLPSKEWAEFRLANLIEANGGADEAILTYKRLSQSVSDKRLKKAIKAAL